MAELFKGISLRKGKDVLNAEEILKNKVVCLLFSASWCPPCRQFSYVLKSFYQELLKADSPIEIIFISSDRTKEDTEVYYNEKHGQWLLLEFGHPFIAELRRKYAVSGIPALIVIRSNGDVITRRGREEIQNGGAKCFSSWKTAAGIK